MVEPKLCDPSVKQLSGYLDISETRHLFFWFEESRQNPDEDPLVLWLNGGPGCSSTTGLLFELGGCNIRDKGENTTFNEYSWNSVANVLYLDRAYLSSAQRSHTLTKRRAYWCRLFLR